MRTGLNQGVVCYMSPRFVRTYTNKDLERTVPSGPICRNVRAMAFYGRIPLDKRNLGLQSPALHVDGGYNIKVRRLDFHRAEFVVWQRRAESWGEAGINRERRR